MFGQKGRPWLVLLFGGLPDLASFGVLLAVRFVTGTLIRKRLEPHGIPEWTILNYNIGHSLLIAGFGAAIMFLWRRDIAFAIDGVSWGTAWVWFPNIAGLRVLLGYRFRQRWKRRRGAA